MFNLARFNLQRFNLQADNETDIPIRDVLKEVFSCSIGYGENSYITQTLNEQIRAKLMVDPGFHSKAVCNENFKYKIKAYVEFYANTDIAAAIFGKFFGSVDSFHNYDLTEEIDNYTYIGCDSWHTVFMEDAIKSYWWLSADHWQKLPALYEIFHCDATTSRFNVLSTYLNLVIPPGGELIIDSNNFVVMLNGANAIHTHSGDWPTLCRDTYDLLIQMGQRAPFQVTMIYEERYL